MSYSMNFKPSAPSADYLYLQQQLAQDAAKKVAEKKPNLSIEERVKKDANLKSRFDGECSHCLSQLLTEQPEGDFNEGIMLTMTKCQHVFHEFCLNQLMQDEKNPIDCCTICRATDLTDIEYIPVTSDFLSLFKTPAKEPNTTAPANTTTPTVTLTPIASAPKEPVVQKSGEQSAALNYLKDSAAKAVWGAYSYLRNEKEETTEKRIFKIEADLLRLEAKWDKFPESCKNDKENIAKLILTIRLSMANPPKDRTAAIKHSKDIEKQVESILDDSTSFNKLCKQAESNLKESIETAEKIYKESLEKAKKTHSEDFQNARNLLLNHLKVLETNLETVAQ